MDFNKILFVTFDYQEKNKPIKSIAVATMESYLRWKIKDIEIDAFSFDMLKEDTILFEQMETLKNVLFEEYDYICVSFYAWNMRFVDSLLNIIRLLNPKAVIIAGGYEVSKRQISNLEKKYQKIDHFIIGYAEESLYQIIRQKNTSKVVCIEVNNADIQPIYSNGLIRVKSNSSIRLETKRGCPYSCNYCAYKNNDHTKMTIHSIDKVKKELLWLNSFNVTKVNILDAVFTTFNFRQILEYLIEINFRPKISFQMKFEILYSILNKDKEILSLFKKLNVELEFGLQSSSTEVLKNVERNNDMKKIISVIRSLHEINIDYTISIIRGLPGESLKTYKELLDFLNEIKSKKYIIYPLTLLSNTRLYDNRKSLKITAIKQNGLDYVVGTYSYNYLDYIKMIELEKVYNSKRVL